MVAVDPQWIDGLAYNGNELRRSQTLQVMSNGTALGGRAGVIPGAGGLNVSVAGSTITVGSGVAWVYQTGQGMYAVPLTSGASLTLAAAHATLPRVDLVYLRVWDTAVDGSGLTQADAVYLAGTASSTPVAPTPVGTQIYLPLATISVPASGGGSPSVNNTIRPVTVAPGGILPDAAAPGYYAGQYRDNGSGLERYDGSSWSAIQPQGIGRTEFARKTADTSRTNNATSTDDPHLTVSLAANATYTLDAFIMYSTSTAADFKIQFATPAGATQAWSPWGISDDSDTNTGGTVGRIRTGISGGAATQFGVLATTLVSLRPVGVIRTAGTAGACTLQWAQGNATASATVVYADSFLKLQRVA